MILLGHNQQGVLKMASTKQKRYEWRLLELDHLGAVTIFLWSTGVL